MQLDEQQQKAVTHDGSVLVIAGPGSGKQTVIAERIKYLIECGTPSSRILALSCKKDPVQEIKHIVSGLSIDPEVRTFHGFGLKLLGEFHQTLGLPAKLDVMVPDEQISFTRWVLEEKLSMILQPWDSSIVTEMTQFINSMKSCGKRPDVLSAKEHPFKNILAYLHYECSRKQLGKIDFNEMLLGSYELLKNKELIREKLTTRYEHLLVDSLEDIYALQYSLLTILCGPDTCVFAIGDDSQDIHPGPGTIPDVLKHFCDQYCNGKLLRLARNYRCTRQIINLANIVLNKNGSEKDVNNSFSLSDGDLPRLTRYETETEEASTVANEIARLRTSGMSLNDIAVLYRKRHVAEPLEEELRKLGIPVIRNEGGASYSGLAYKSIMAHFDVVMNPRNIDSIICSLEYPKKTGLPMKDILVLLRSSKVDGNPLDALSQFPELQKYVSVMNNLILNLDKIDLVDLVSSVFYDTGLYDQDHEDNLWLSNSEPFDRIIEAARFYAKETKKPDLPGFLAWFCRGDVLTLHTMHSVKDRAFDVVYLIGLEQGVIPHRNVSKEQLQKERLTLNTAVTRARKTLRMSYSTYRREWPRELSELLQHINESVVEFKGGVEHAFKVYLEHSVSNDDIIRFRHPDRVPKKESLITSAKYGKGVVRGVFSDGTDILFFIRFYREPKARWLILDHDDQQHINFLRMHVNLHDANTITGFFQDDYVYSKEKGVGKVVMLSRYNNKVKIYYYTCRISMWVDPTYEKFQPLLELK